MRRLDGTVALSRTVAGESRVAALVGFEVIAGATGLLVGLGALESWRHTRTRNRIPIRIHVNGTRGKSSVVRLVASGLRAGGRCTCAKTTGTLARMLLPDERELPVFRPAGANVVEQIRIVRAAAAAGAEALVVECMALQPELQWLSERWFVRATHAIITNARPDHLDVMGPDDDDVARALCGMIPPGGVVYTAERKRLAILEAAARDRGARLVVPEVEVEPDELAPFSYTAHPDNVALALAVCADLGVDRRVALTGMWAGRPDPGAMTSHLVDFFGRQIVFVNGFAANDPESTQQIWRIARDRHTDGETTIALVNCRDDRADRSQRLGASILDWCDADQIVLIGSGTYFFARAAIEAGWPAGRMVHAEFGGADHVFEVVMGLVRRSALVMGVGNASGIGLEVVSYFRNRERIAEPLT